MVPRKHHLRKHSHDHLIVKTLHNKPTLSRSRTLAPSTGSECLHSVQFKSCPFLFRNTQPAGSTQLPQTHHQDEMGLEHV